MPTPRRPAAPASAPLTYQVELLDVHAHLFQVTLTIAQPQAEQLLRLPVWIPGSYLVREFAKNLQHLECRQGGRRLAVQQKDKASWQVACKPERPLQVRYQLYALDTSVRTAWLDSARAFFNGTSLFLLPDGAAEQPCTLELTAPAAQRHWQVATGLPPLAINKNGWGRYHAPDYHHLVDCPVEMGAFWSGRFVAHGIPHRVVVAGAPPSFDGDVLLKDTQRICEASMAFWHPGIASSKRSKIKAPFSEYVFLLNTVHDGYGGLEHRNSTALLCSRKDLPRQPHNRLDGATVKQPEGYKTLLGLICHEYFHTWNVKRLRPAEFTRYDYTQENYTELLWFFEGFTSYYDELLLRRAGLLDNTAYLQALSKTINQVQQTPGRHVQSVAQASFDAWIKYYRPDENTANATVSYYTKGALVALCLDLTLRAEGHSNLDAVMRQLWQQCQGGPMTESDVLAALEHLGQRSFATEVQRWVHGTGDLPMDTLLERHGVYIHREPAPIAQQLGLRVKEEHGVWIQQVLRGGAAEQAGFHSGDEWLAVTVGSGAQAQSWRLQTLDDLKLYANASKKCLATVARDKRLLQLPLTLTPPCQTLRLVVGDPQRVNAWLESTP